MGASSHPDLLFSKQRPGAPTRKREARATKQDELDEKAEVRKRDGSRCRVPFSPHEGPVQAAHVVNKGMGGDHGFRSTTADMFQCCRSHHLGSKDSLHSGQLKVKKLSKFGANRPMRFTLWKESRVA